MAITSRSDNRSSQTRRSAGIGVVAPAGHHPHRETLMLRPVCQPHAVSGRADVADACVMRHSRPAGRRRSEVEAGRDAIEHHYQTPSGHAAYSVAKGSVIGSDRPCQLERLALQRHGYEPRDVSAHTGSGTDT